MNNIITLNTCELKKIYNKNGNESAVNYIENQIRKQTTKKTVIKSAPSDTVLRFKDSDEIINNVTEVLVSDAKYNTNVIDNNNYNSDVILDPTILGSNNNYEKEYEEETQSDERVEKLKELYNKTKQSK